MSFFKYLILLIVFFTSQNMSESFDYSKVSLLKPSYAHVTDNFSAYASSRNNNTIVIQRQSLLFHSSLKNKILIIVNEFIYDSIENKIMRYADDISHKGYSAEIYTSQYGDAEQLKAFIKDHSHDLSGCVFVGDLPCAWYEIENDYNTYGYTQFPCDLFFCDLDGQWLDEQLIHPMKSGVYDSHSSGTGDEGPEIFIGRIDASKITGKDEIELLCDYFDKLHAYYNGEIECTKKALTYTEDDWKNNWPFWTDILQGYSKRTSVVAPHTSCSDYKNNRLVDPEYDFVQLACHSGYSGHYFTRGGSLSSSEISEKMPQAMIYNLFCCSASRFTSSNCLGCSYIFNESERSLVTVGSTKTGSMLIFKYFYGSLGKNNCIGAALQHWFNMLEPYEQTEINWHFGMTVLGDPLVHISTDVLSKERHKIDAYIRDHKKLPDIIINTINSYFDNN